MLSQSAAERAHAHQQEIGQGIKAHLPGLVRVSFGCYNNENEVDWFIEALERILRGEYQGHYIQDPASGDFRPQGYAPEVAPYFAL